MPIDLQLDANPSATSNLALTAFRNRVHVELLGYSRLLLVDRRFDERLRHGNHACNRAFGPDPHADVFGRSHDWHWLRATLVVALTCALLGLPAPILAQEASSLVDRGITPELAYDGSGFTNLAGGLSRASTYSGNLNLRLTLALDRLMSAPRQSTINPAKGSDWADSRCCHPMTTSLRSVRGITPRATTI